MIDVSFDVVLTVCGSTTASYPCIVRVFLPCESRFGVAVEMVNHPLLLSARGLHRAVGI
jgi:hypothetical protein